MRVLRSVKILLGILFLLNIVNAQPMVGEESPTFFLRTLDGESFFLSRHVGENARQGQEQPIVLSFFATWCIPCKAEIPILHQLQEAYPEVKFLLVNVEEKSDLVTKYVQANNITLPVLMDMYSVVANKFGIVNEKNVAVLPQLVVIDQSGKLAYAHEGYKQGDEKALETALQQMLKPAPAAAAQETGTPIEQDAEDVPEKSIEEQVNDQEKTPS